MDVAEGPVVHHLARQLREVLEGRTVEVEFGVKKLMGRRDVVNGRQIRRVEAWGKQFRIHFDDAWVLMVHLLMWGTWRVYRRGAKWDKPRKRARLVIRTSESEAVAFSAPVVELMTEVELAASKWGGLGPDPLRQDFSRSEATRRLKACPAREIGKVLLDQTVISGVGNILRNEILFAAGIHPARLAGDLRQAELDAVIAITVRQMEAWLERMNRRGPPRAVYRRSRRPCPACGTAIEFFRQAGRATYACPNCQL
jgi:endonuclease-8